jgi:hypothetical protein
MGLECTRAAARRARAAARARVRVRIRPRSGRPPARAAAATQLQGSCRGEGSRRPLLRTLDTFNVHACASQSSTVDIARPSVSDTMAASSSEDGGAVALSTAIELAAELEAPLRELPAHGLPARSVASAAATLKAKDPYVPTTQPLYLRFCEV